MIPQSPIQNDLFQKFPKYELFWEHFKPSNLSLLYEDIVTVEESIAQVRISIEDIRILYSVKNIHAGIDYLSKWVDYLQDFLNINNRLKKVQDVAAVLYRDHRHLYLSDLTIIFNGILGSEYGRFYGSVDSQTIITSFRVYNVSRYNAYLQAYRLIKQLIDSRLDEIKKTAREAIYEKLVEEGVDKSTRWAELEKRLNQQLPEILKAEEEKLMKEMPKLKSPQE